MLSPGRSGSIKPRRLSLSTLCTAWTSPKRANGSQSRSVAVCLFLVALRQTVCVCHPTVVLSTPISLFVLQECIVLFLCHSSSYCCYYWWNMKCRLNVQYLYEIQILKPKVCKGKMHRESEPLHSVWMCGCGVCLFPIKCTKRTWRTGGRTENIVVEVVTYSLFTVWY